MTSDALITLIITLAAGVLLISEILRPDQVGILVMVSLGIAGLVPARDLFSGFSGDAVITIIAITIISAGLFQTGIAHRLTSTLDRLAGKNESRALVLVMLTAAVLSLFMNNIAAVGILMPAVMGLSRQSNIPPSRLLMPLAFGTVLGGMATLLTTSNIIVSGTLRQAGLAAFSLLDFFPIGAPLIIAGIGYMLIMGRRLLPAKLSENTTHPPLGEELVGLYHLDEQLVEIVVLPDSRMAGKSISQGKWASNLGVTVVGLLREGKLFIAPGSQTVIRVGDLVLAQGQVNLDALSQHGLQLTQKTRVPHALTSENVCLGEALLSPHSPFVGKTLAETHFRERYSLNVLSIWRAGKPLHGTLADLHLQTGDTLLVQGAPLNMQLLHNDQDFILLEQDPDAVLRPEKAWLALGITLVTLTIAALGILPVALAAMAGALLIILTGCLGMAEMYRSIEWRAVFLIAGMWPLSAAIHDTGLADLGIRFLLGQVIGVTPILLAAFLLFAGLVLTQFMGGQVAALILSPLAIAAAAAVQVDPRAMGMAAALSCSLAFLTPFGHPVNVMVMGSGGYKTRDFLRVGTPLTILVFLLILAGLKIFWRL